MTDSVNESNREPASPAAQPALIEKALHSPTAWLRFLTPALLGLAADLTLKAWAFPAGVPTDPYLPAGRHPATPLLEDALPVIPNVLGFATTVNHGAVFGIGQGMVFYFLIFSILALALILWVFVTTRRNQWLVQLALGLITAGALGNLYDRAMFNGVRDMLRFYVTWYQYIFNLADVALCIGVPLLMLCWIFGKDPKPQPPAV